MHGLAPILPVLMLSLACGTDGEPSTGDAGSSGGGGGTSPGSSSGDPSATTGDTMQTAPEDSTGLPPATTTGMETTTGEPADSSDSGPPLEGDVLQNDSWTPADSLTWQSWPSPGDCWASVFQGSPMQYPFAVVGAIAAVGNGDGVHTFEVGVWEVDNQGTPTTELASRTVDIDGTTTALTEIDLSGLGLPVIGMNDEFAIVMCHTDHMGLPSIATDADGTVDASRNWVYQDLMGAWVPAPDFFGIDGDFILRAVIMPQ